MWEGGGLSSLPLANNDPIMQRRPFLLILNVLWFCPTGIGSHLADDRVKIIRAGKLKAWFLFYEYLTKTEIVESFRFFRQDLKNKEFE